MQLLAGADDATLSKLKLTRDASSYAYLKQGGATAVAGMDDRAHYAGVLQV